MDLLAWVRPSAIILHFPVDREAQRVRDVARQLDRRHGKAAEKFWRTECNRLYGRLQAQGMPKELIDAEIDRFALAVRAELESRHWRGARPEGGDAA